MILEALWTNLFNKQHLNIRDYLKKVPVFNDITERDLKRIERYVIRRKFLTNEYIFREMEPGAGMYIIVSGEVKIQLENGKQIKELACLKEGDFFGEMALLDESPRSASALAVSDKVELVSFFRGDLLKVIEEYPNIACKILWNIGSVISERLRKNNEILHLCQKSN